MKQLTEKQAIELAKSGEWKSWPDQKLVGFQLSQDLLCMDFSYFHKKTEKVLGRPVFTHEFAFKDNLVKEYLKEKPMPTFGEIIGLIPKGSPIICLLT